CNLIRWFLTKPDHLYKAVRRERLSMCRRVVGRHACRVRKLCESQRRIALVEGAHSEVIAHLQYEIVEDSPPFVLRHAPAERGSHVDSHPKRNSNQCPAYMYMPPFTRSTSPVT